ncbi:ABC transporter ATP-binding protein [Geminicoccaceae bacterium 1502E]|nr:ABC transporter ATP-binding protein [Geminicoccaceae bacterium 1502E]
MGEPLLACRNLSISYRTRSGDVPAVSGFDLEVGRGETVGLVGESGCGKSTVAFAIMRHLGRSGFIADGSIRFDGRDLLAMEGEELRRLRGGAIGMVYQEPMASLNPSMTIGRQLAEVPMIHGGAGRGEARRQALEMLERVQLPDPERIMESWPHQLSGGQQQRVVIAMALLGRPRLLILDEPTTALDVTVEAGIVALIGGLARELGTSVLFISHNLGLIRETCERVCVMYAGEAVETGRVGAVFGAMRHPYTRGLLNAVPVPGADKNARPLVPIPGTLPLPGERPPGCNFHPRCGFFEPGRCDRGVIPMREAGPDHTARCVRFEEIDWAAARPRRMPAAIASPGEKVLEVEGLRKYYALPEKPLAALIEGGGGQAVRANESIDFAAREAETVAIVGESGCGKSTFAKVLMGLETATDGQIRLAGREVGSVPVERRRPSTVGLLQMIFQNPFETLNPSHSVGYQIARVVRRFGGLRDREAVRARVMELLDLVRLPRAFHDRRPRQLSGGQKQRVAIARAFAGDPRVVVADEPVSALDVSVQAAIARLLLDIQRRNGTTLLFISHDLGLVRYLADRVLVMYLGRIVEQGTVEEVFSPPYHPYTEALLSAAPVADASVSKRRILLEGELPSATSPPPGCPFQTRCPRKLGRICETELPPERVFGGGHKILCHIPPEELEAVAPVLETPAEAAD